MPQPPYITYIIVTWNNEKEIFNCLNTLKKYTKTRCDVFIVDNASSDKTVDICKGSDFVTLIESGVNIGFAAANNVALSRVRTEYVCFLNPDVILIEDIIEAQISALAKDEKIGLTACRLLNLDASFQKSYFNFLTSFEIFSEILHLGKIVPNFLRRIYFQSYYQCHSQFSPDWVIGAEMVMRTSEAQQIEGFSEDYFMYTEDMDLCMKVRRILGKTIRYIPEVSLVHLGGASEAQNVSYKKQNKVFENLKRFNKKFYGKNGNAIFVSAMSAALIREVLLKLFYFKKDRKILIDKTHSIWLSAKHCLF